MLAVAPMGSSSARTFPVIPIDPNASVPLYRQIYNGYRSAILRGDLRPSQQIPSTRHFASELRVSRFPVLHAYSQLLAEGYFESRVGSGTFVASSLPEQFASVESNIAPRAKLPSGPRNVSRSSLLYPSFDRARLPRGWGAFGLHQPAFDHFPFRLWSKLIARHSRNPAASALHHIDPLGSERFRTEICSYLRTARGVHCTVGQIMIVSGSQQAFDITTRVLLDPGSAVFVEDPCYDMARTVLTAASCRLIPVPVDQEGMDISAALQLNLKARAAFVIPSHQYPLGSTMTLARRLELLSWAQRTGAWVIEDDRDSEYRYDSNPISSLHGLDVNAQVIYIGTFSKVMFPSLRIGYIVVPEDLVDRFTAVRVAMDIFPPYLPQEVLADFLHEGHFGQHIRKMRSLYGRRREVLIQSLHADFGDMLEEHGAEAGMHVAVTLPEGYRDTEICAAAAEARLYVSPLSPSYIERAPRQGFILGFGSTPVEQIPDAVHALKPLLRC